MKEATDAAAPMTDNVSEFMPALYFGQVMEALRTHASTNSITGADLFKQIANDASEVGESRFVEFLSALPTLVEDKECIFKEEQLFAVFRLIDAKGGGVLSSEDFAEHFRSRYLVVSEITMTEGKEIGDTAAVRKLAVGELVDGLEESFKEEKSGLLRVFARAQKDDSQGYVTVMGQTGTMMLEQCSYYTNFKRKVDSVCDTVAGQTKEGLSFIDKKMEELKSMKPGPQLTESKSELLRMRPKVNKIQAAYQTLKRKIIDAQKKIDASLASEKKKKGKRQKISAKRIHSSPPTANRQKNWSASSKRHLPK